jgi:hypothetical protein
MKRPAQPEEIAPAFVFLASPSCSSYITGRSAPNYWRLLGRLADNTRDRALSAREKNLLSEGVFDFGDVPHSLPARRRYLRQSRYLPGLVSGISSQSNAVATIAAPVSTMNGQVAD